MEPAKSFVVELAEILLLALGLYFVITFAIQTVHVIGYSMVPTLNDNDYLLATKADLHFTRPNRGDIVILKSPFDQSQDYVKRVIGLPGEQVRIVRAHIYINGHLLDEPYLDPHDPWVTQTSWPTAGSSDPSGVIPPDRYFVMGDNRNHSSDSRTFGPISIDDIESRAWVRILPLDHFGLLPKRPTLEPGTSLPAAA